MVGSLNRWLATGFVAVQRTFTYPLVRWNECESKLTSAAFEISPYVRAEAALSPENVSNQMTSLMSKSCVISTPSACRAADDEERGSLIPPPP